MGFKVLHCSHSVWPDLDVNVPGEQSSHDSIPGAAPNEPGKHGFGSAEPTAQLDPAGHSMH